MTQAPRPADGIDEVDSLPAARFVEAVAPLFEGAPGFLWRLAAARGDGFGSWERLFGVARTLAHAMPEPLQVDLIDAHPRLGARRENLSESSAREQGVGAPAATRAAIAAPAMVALDRLNAEYEARFGFRYCVFVAGRPLAALVPGLQASLGASRGEELHRALDAVVDIATARHEASGEKATGRKAPDRKAAAR